MADSRKDPKGRALRNGETFDQKKGRYRYSYIGADGKRYQIYSYTLTKNDKVPPGRTQKQGESLREKEAIVQSELVNGIDHNGGNQTVIELLEKYITIQMPNVRETTRKGYRTQLTFMHTNPRAKLMASKHIKDVDPLYAETWMQELHTKEGRSYSSLHTLKGMLRPAFAFAVKSRWVYLNPFDFSMTKKAYGGTKTRDALTRADMRRFLDFIQQDKHFRRYYDGIYILFFTGLRISEFCGLTIEDIDFKQHVVYVRRQLLRVWDGKTNKYYIEEPKTSNGTRIVPMMPGVEDAFRHVIANRPQIHEKIIWDQLHQNNATGFLWVDREGHYEVAQHWSNHLRWARAKFNRIFKDELPPVTPHVCRHTFCSNMAGAGMSPKTLQNVMGHSSIEFTLQVYTHLADSDVKESFFSFFNSGAYDVHGYKQPDISSVDDYDDDEGEPDFSEEPDDDSVD